MRDPRLDPYDQAIAEAVEQIADETGVPRDLLADVQGSSAVALEKPILPVTPPWVTDVQKWQSLPRAERRKLERHHRKVNGLR